MAPVDYMKAIACVTKAFDGKRDVEIKAAHKTIDIFEVSMQMDGGTVSYTLRSGERALDLVIARKHFDSIKFDRWVARLEFELEQALLANIRLEVKESSADYTITISN
ncbi:MAG: hypothetical protein KBA15_02060 [Spirochaetes bacterium]|jgi:hypothetical protein|nr:hypothetical protein [Spirochaetota bacterium]